MNTRETAFAATAAAPDASSATLAAPSTNGAPKSGTMTAASMRSAVLPPRPGANPSNNLDERYAKKKVLGAGGMGEVVLAEDRDIGRSVALKYLPLRRRRSALARFVDEIRIVGSLEHPNIVPIHDVGVDENSRYYFVMKHVEGETLEDIIDEARRRRPRRTSRSTRSRRASRSSSRSCARSSSRTRKGYVHRDIKPANVMVGAFGEVVLMDWGIAKRRKAPAERWRRDRAPRRR